jgi:hypothetical protein|tara:strand:- start:2204 stop:2650 length:447 start_codon:yes stop_codon:yes gene_type:complete
MFKRTLALCLALTTTNSAATAGETLDIWRSDPTHIFDAKDVELADVIWAARPLVIFADSPLDPIFAQQMKLLRAGQAIVQDRDMIIIVDTDPSAKTIIRETLHPKGFNWALIGKDGMVKLRKPFAWDMRELSRVIDKMPIRQQEMSKP